uniref:Uncharacterized protein n=1 Tax=Rhizophagus irregularis (strain DAOM 181602 / DAOM 197198 / MUCL 43194) TaxID=747089 RepID=U9U690_RHIID
MIEIFQRGIVKSARKALERRVYECFGSNGNGSPGPTETPSNNSAPNGAPLDSKVQDPCRFVWIPVGDPNKISISNVQENLYTTKFFPLRAISNGLYTVDREFYPHASEVGKDYEGEMGPSCSKKGLASSLYDFIAYGHFNNKYGACNTHACTEKAACIDDEPKLTEQSYDEKRMFPLDMFVGFQIRNFTDFDQC